MKDKSDDKNTNGRDGELRLHADELMRKPRKGGSVDEVSLESRRRAVAYGRARGNV